MKTTKTAQTQTALMVVTANPLADAMKAAGLSDAQIRIAIAALTSKGGGRTTPKECKCGCGGMTKGGTYRPGHDAKHMSAVLAGMRAAV